MKDDSFYIGVKEAAEILSIDKQTIRSWDKKGKITVIRHPMNRYRMYKRSEIVELAHKIGVFKDPVRKFLDERDSGE